MERRPRGISRCVICNHREHASMDLALARGLSQRAVAKRFGVSSFSVHRHVKNGHLSPALKAKLIAGPALDHIDLEKLRETEGASLLSHLIGVRQRLYAAMDLADDVQDVRALTRVVGALHQNFELVGKLLGSLSTGSVTNNFMVSPQYVQVSVAILDALNDHPSARVAVASALRALENDAAKQIELNARPTPMVQP